MPELNGLIEQALDRNHDLRKAAFRVLEERAIAYGSGAGLILNAFREVADVLVALQTRKEQLASQRQHVAAARESLELADIRYRKGLVSYIDVIDAQRIVLDAELGVVQTERARLVDMVSLFKAVGGGWEDEQLAHLTNKP